MLWIAGYLVFVAYAAGLFMYSVSHDRPLAAVGILLSVSGIQLTVLDTMDIAFSVSLAVLGLALIGRDLVLVLPLRVGGAFVVAHRDHHSEHVS